MERRLVYKERIRAASQLCYFFENLVLVGLWSGETSFEYFFLRFNSLTSCSSYRYMITRRNDVIPQSFELERNWNLQIAFSVNVRKMKR